MTDNYDPVNRVRIKPHKNRGKVAGFYVYLPRQAVASALDAEPPETLYAARLVLDHGKKQILIRLYRENE